MAGQHAAHPHHLAALPSPSPQEFYTDLKDAEREGEVNRILSAFKLNPYEQLGLHNDATPEEVRRQYRKVRAAGVRCGWGGGGDGMVGCIAGSAQAPGSPPTHPLRAPPPPPPPPGLAHGAPRQVQARAGQGRV